jgi:ketosteroid isomerase-like protein
MRPTLFAVAALGTLACSTQKTAGGPDTASSVPATLATTPDPAPVRRAIDSANGRMAAAMIKGDTAAMASIFAADVIMLPANEKIEHGRSEVLKNIAAMVKPGSVTSAKFASEDVIISGDYAIETGASEFMFQPAKGAKPVRSAGKYLTVWKKQPDGSYQVVRDIYNTDAPAR